jgi:hypothetical protein
MPLHACIDPHDQYAQVEAMVAFETKGGVIRLLSVRDAWGEDILADLEDVQRQAPEREILDDYQQHMPVFEGRPRSGPITDRQMVG